MTGVITKGIAGFYYVFSGGKSYECKAKGLFRKKGITPLAGDRAEFSVNDDGSGSIEKILTRKNFFDRPPVANVDCFVLVAAVKDPQPSFLMLDRFAVTAEKSGAGLIIVVNKEDLTSENSELITAFKSAYEGIYPLFFVSAKEGLGIDALKTFLKGKQFALAGPSGVGKSSLTNLLIAGGSAKTGEISQRLARGKNTTRHSQLFIGEDFSLFDTPGFTSFENNLEDETELSLLFPEFEKFSCDCRFTDCRHLNDKGCAVARAADEGRIAASRYESYKEIYKSISEKKKY